MISVTRPATPAEKAKATHALLISVLELGTASTDDAHRRFELPASVDQRTWGTITMRLITEGILIRIGDKHTCRSVAHFRRIGLYFAPDPDRGQAYASSLHAQATKRTQMQRTLFDFDEVENDERRID